MTHQSRQIAENAFEITTEFEGSEVKFNVVVANDESEIPDLVECHLNYLRNPTPVYSEPEPLTAQQKLEAAGLTVDELKDLLGL